MALVAMRPVHMCHQVSAIGQGNPKPPFSAGKYMYLLKQMRITPRLHHRTTEGSALPMLMSSAASSAEGVSDGALSTLKTKRDMLSSITPLQPLITVVVRLEKPGCCWSGALTSFWIRTCGAEAGRPSAMNRVMSASSSRFAEDAMSAWACPAQKIRRKHMRTDRGFIVR